MGRNCIGIDINIGAAMLARDRLAFSRQNGDPSSIVKTYVGDARQLDLVSDNSMDLAVLHPPYAGIIRYGERPSVGDLSRAPTIEAYLLSLRQVTIEIRRVLKGNGHCGVLIGDTRRRKHYVPISYLLLREFLGAGFLLREDIIKIQHNTTSERGKWKSCPVDFYKIGHEHLFVFRKPSNQEDAENMRWSGRELTRSRLPKL